MHKTKDKGDLAVAKAIFDLTKKGYKVFTPTFCEHLPFDLIAYKDLKCFRIQVKYSSSGYIENETTWTNKNGTHAKKYNLEAFDYYAIYNEETDIIVYPSIKYGGKTIRFKLPNSPTPFYWYEDFLNLTSDANKKSYRDFNFKLKY